MSVDAQSAFLKLQIPLERSSAMERLSASEQEVAIALTRGWSTKSLAAFREVSATTVSNQIASVFRKLEVGSRIELAARLANVTLGPEIRAGAPRPRDPVRASHVLLLEDAPRVREEITRALELAGHHVTATSDLDEARVKLATSYPDVALFDIRIGDRSALELLREPVLERCPVVLVSGAADLEEAITGLSLGAWDFVDKSAGVARMRIAVGEALRGARKTRPLPPEAIHARLGAPDEIARHLVEGRARFVGAVDHDGSRHVIFERCVDEPLPARERRALAAMLKLTPIKAIAFDLGVSDVAAWTAVDRMLDRLGLASRIEALACLAPLAGEAALDAPDGPTR
jgi:DNA-binding NarL/FixJ family response regulator